MKKSLCAIGEFSTAHFSNFTTSTDSEISEQHDGITGYIADEVNRRVKGEHQYIKEYIREIF